MAPDSPEPESLRQQLQIEWADHIQSRAQSWRAVQLEMLLVAALIGIDASFKDQLLVIMMASFASVAAVMGFVFSLIHWRVQERIFRNIESIEKALRLDQVIRLHASGGVQLRLIFDPRSRLAVVMILRVHLIILIFATAYLIVRLRFS